MKRQHQQYDTDLLQMQQQVDLMKSMGLFQDPTQQAMGLVQLMNTSQAPGIQQEQFGREMGFKELMGQQEQDYRNRTLDQQSQHQKWQRGSGDKELAMRGQALGLDREKLTQDKNQSDEMLKWRNKAMIMDFLQLLVQGQMGATGAGINPQVAGQMGDRVLPGFSGLFNPQASGNGMPADWGAFDNPDIPNDALWKAMQGVR
jgi:hypothetical protein